MQPLYTAQPFLATPPQPHPFYSTCRFSQDLDLLSLAHTFPSRLLTLRLADVLEPLYFFGEFWALPPPVGVPVPDAGDLFLFKFRFELLLFLNRSLVFSGFSNLSRICVRTPTRSSSTLWLMPTEVSMYLQSNEVAMSLPSAISVTWGVLLFLGFVSSLQRCVHMNIKEI